MSPTPNAQDQMYIEKHWDIIAAIAWREFTVHGRGALLVQNSGEPVPSCPNSGPQFFLTAATDFLLPIPERVNRGNGAVHRVAPRDMDVQDRAMEIFSFFIVIPEILASRGFGWIMNHMLHHNRLAAVVSGGAFLAIAAQLVQRRELQPCDLIDRG